MCNKGRHGNGTKAGATLTRKQQPSERRTQAITVAKPVQQDPPVGESELQLTGPVPPRNPETTRRPRPKHGERRLHTTVHRPHTITASSKHTMGPALLKNIDHLEGSQESLGSSQDSLGSVQHSPSHTHHTPRILLTTPGNTKYDYHDSRSDVAHHGDHEESRSSSMPTLLIKDRKPTLYRPPLNKRAPKKCPTGRVKLPPLSIPSASPIPVVKRLRSFSDPDIKLPRLTHL